MKLIIDIPDSDYTAVRCEGLYYIGSYKLAESVTTAFQTAIPYAERPKGKWIYHEEWENEGGCGYECSCCGRAYDYDMNFCGYCGADMRKGGAK